MANEQSFKEIYLAKLAKTDESIAKSGNWNRYGGKYPAIVPNSMGRDKDEVDMSPSKTISDEGESRKVKLESLIKSKPLTINDMIRQHEEYFAKADGLTGADRAKEKVQEEVSGKLYEMADEESVRPTDSAEGDVAKEWNVKKLEEEADDVREGNKKPLVDKLTFDKPYTENDDSVATEVAERTEGEAEQQRIDAALNKSAVAKTSNTSAGKNVYPHPKNAEASITNHRALQASDRKLDESNKSAEHKTDVHRQPDMLLQMNSSGNHKARTTDRIDPTAKANIGKEKAKEKKSEMMSKPKPKRNTKSMIGKKITKSNDIPSGKMNTPTAPMDKSVGGAITGAVNKVNNVATSTIGTADKIVNAAGKKKGMTPTPKPAQPQSAPKVDAKAPATPASMTKM